MLKAERQQFIAIYSPVENCITFRNNILFNGQHDMDIYEICSNRNMKTAFLFLVFQHVLSTQYI